MHNKDQVVVIYSAFSDLETHNTIELRNLSYKYIDKICLESNNKKFELKLFTTFSKINVAIEQTKYVVNEIEKLINYKYDEQMLEKLDLYDAYIPSQRATIRSTWEWITKAKANKIVHISDENIPEFKNVLETGLNNNFNSYFDIYTDLIKVKDSLGKFIMVYSLLLELLGYQRQCYLDKHYIRIQEPNVREEKTTKENKNYNETIYTHLRNRIGHLDKETDINWLLQQVHSYLPGLKRLTRKAIEDLI